MIRLRIWLLTVLATLCVAGPTVAYWPVLFALPAVFGQDEAPLPPLPKCAMPYAEGAPHCHTEVSCDKRCCELVGDCLTTWRKLWQQGRFCDAYELAKCAVQAAPDNVEARHALIVSQIVKQTHGQPARIVYPTFFFSGQTSAGTLTPDLDVPARTASCDIDCAVTCPLTKFFATLFGDCKECMGAKCASCPACAGICKTQCDVQCADAAERAIQRKLESPYNFFWQDASFGDVLHDLRKLTGVAVIADMKALHAAGLCLNMPVSLAAENIKLKSALNLLCQQHNLGYVIKDQCLQITTAEKAAGCCQQAEGQTGCCAERVVRGHNGPTVIYIVRQTLPPLPTAPTMVPCMPPMAELVEAPLPPPCFAPPPPPMSASYGQQYIPVPAPQPPVVLQPSFAYGYSADGKIIRSEMAVPPRPAAASQPVRPVLYDPAAETCEAMPTPMIAPMPAHVRITQHGSRVQMASPNYHAQCDRIRGGADGQLILEGNVQLMSRRHGQTMSITAQRVVLNVKDDQFVVEQAEGMESSRVNIAPVALPVGHYGNAEVAVPLPVGHYGSERATVVGKAEALSYFPLVIDPTAVDQGIATGQMFLANAYGEDMVFIINQKPYRVPPGVTVPLVAPAGVVNYEIVSPTWGVRARNMVNLPPNETFTLSAK
jgi:hypothetical protein